MVPIDYRIKWKCVNESSESDAEQTQMPIWNCVYIEMVINVSAKKINTNDTIPLRTLFECQEYMRFFSASRTLEANNIVGDNLLFAVGKYVNVNNFFFYFNWTFAYFTLNFLWLHALCCICANIFEFECCKFGFVPFEIELDKLKICCAHEAYTRWVNMQNVRNSFT